MRQTMISLISVTYAISFCTQQAQAVPVTIEISGEVTSASGSRLPDTIYEGVTFTGTYTYESSTINTSHLDYVGQYVHNSPYGVKILMGGFEFMTEPNHVGQFEIGIVNGTANYDWYRIMSNENISVNDTTVESISWALGGLPSTISSIALPTSEPNLGDWNTNVLKISGSGDLGGLLIEGTVTQAIPEPATFLFLALGGMFVKPISPETRQL